VNQHPSYGIVQGIFRELLVRHVRLGIRDYLDAVRALRMGFGGHSKQELRLLCHVLWGRNETEIRIIDAVFDLIPAAKNDQGAISHFDRYLRDNFDLRDALNQREQEYSEAGGRQAVVPTDEPQSRVRFGGPDEQGGLALPPLDVGLQHERFTFQPQTVVSQREFAVIWRRLRKMTREGPRLELDVEATVRVRCDKGVLPRPVLRANRRNAARLLVFADASPSMAPWYPFLQTLAASLALGQLRAAEVYYFSNFPRQWIFYAPNLRERISLDEALRRNAGAALLIVSDAGSVRGHFSPDRVRQTRRFLDRVAEHFRPIVWVNPMPRTRWPGTSAAELARQSRVLTLPLDKEALIRAVDLLRGAK
jgi:uncharacterized protein